MLRQNKTLATLSAALLFGLLSVSAHADFMSKGRARAIRNGLAARVNAQKIAHVNYDIQTGKFTPVKETAFRFRSKPTKGMVNILGAQHRSIKWQLPGLINGIAKSTTPVVGNGGKLTKIVDFKINALPRGMPMPLQLPKAMQKAAKK